MHNIYRVRGSMYLSVSTVLRVYVGVRVKTCVHVNRVSTRK